jgi:Tol biopolymer transport system component/tRNA A-37 threonylcarbamoyl transferase component Bud32
MALMPGMTLGNFEIIAPLGAGGMGEVYRARDTRLDREVALKILPDAVARDPDRTARFAREARTLAALNHPHIAQLHGLEEAGDVRALVMELVEGEDLSQLIARGPLPLDDALPIARQIADALEAAHDAGIIHRDLKPANIKVRPDGTVKVLDFGLAKALEPAVAAAGDQFASPTITSPAQMTHAGMILGTAAYMSPEQARGRVLDRRTDVWAFGCVLFEMLTGVRAFSGDDVTETLATIMKSDPPTARLPADTPVEIRRLLTRCLQKDRRLRLQHIGDARLELEDAAHPTSASPTAAVPRGPGWRLWLGGAATALAALGAGIGLSEWRRAREPVTPMQFAIASPPQTTFATPPGGGTGVAPQFAISPDGSAVVFVADNGKGSQLWHRPLNTVDARILPGTDGAAFPFWSPDSQSVGFFADSKLKRIRVESGPPSVVCDAPQGRGGTWNANNVIVFSPSATSALQRVTAIGGIPQDVSTLDAEYGETSHRFPFFLPDGTHFMYTASVGTCCPAARSARIKIGVLDATTTETLTNMESSVAYASGHLLFADPTSGTLMARPFDATSRKFAGEPFAVAGGLASEGSRYASFSVSSNGLLVHGSGARRIQSQLTWLDRAGRQQGTVGDVGVIMNMALAPDDTRAAVARIDPQTGNRDIWVVDSTTNAESRVSFDAGEDDAPVWAVGGQQVLFVGQRPDSWSIISKATVAATKEQVLFTHKGLFRDNLNVNDVSADGALILLQLRGSLEAADLWMLRSGTTTPEPYSQSKAFKIDAAFSPDGKWVAYQSNEVGQRPNVYVQPYPATGGVFQVSRDFGYKPLWRHDGKELFFLNDQGLMAVPIDIATGFHAGAPRLLFQVALLGRGANAGRQYGVTRDGQRFLMNVPQQESKPQALTVTTNWLGRK